MVRPVKLDGDLRERIVTMVRSGIFLKDAAGYYGVGRSTAFGWMQRGRKEIERMEREGLEEPHPDELIYVEFLDGVSRARSHANVQDTNVIAQAARDDPYWAEKFLRLRNPELNVENVNVFEGQGVMDPDGDADEQPLSADDIAQLQDIARKQRAGTDAPESPGVGGDEREV